jgi:serine/threonine-protein kinase
MKKCPTCKETYPGDFAVCPRDGSTLVEAGAWSEGTLVRGKYRILSKLGQGGMGSVFKARHVAFDELRALKVMNPELVSDELFVKRFKHEAVITRKLQHPNAVRVDDIDETEDGRPFIVMEYIEGQSLKKVMQEQGPMPVLRVCSIIKQAAAGLDAAHRLGMVHRDIKPDNIALIETPQGEVAKVLDFGIAKIKESRAEDSAGSGLTGTGVIIGTPQYMSPEQAMGKRGDDLDGRSDLYSLGVVMYQMLAGELPFKADTAMDMLLAHLQKPPLPLQTVRPDLGIPDKVANLVARLLEKKPEARVPSAGALIEDIANIEGEFAAPGPTRVIKAVDLAAVEAAQATRVQAAVPDVIGTGREPSPQPEPVSQPHVPVPGLPSRPAVQAQPSPPPRPAPVAAPKSSMWLVWVSIGIVLIVLGGGGVWYKTMRHPSVTPGVTTTSPSANPTTVPSGSTGTAAPAQSTASATPSNTNPQTSSPTAGPTPTQTQMQQSGTPGGAAGAPTASNPSAPTAVQPPASNTVKEQEKPTAPPRKAVDTQKVLDAAQFYFQRGKYDEEIELLNRALKLDPHNDALLEKKKKAQSAKAAEEKINQ